MNWEEVGAIGQVLGSIAVFVTLIYLAIQVRHSRAETLRSIRQSRSDAVREMQFQTAQSEWLNRVLIKASRAYGEGESPFIDELVRRGLPVEEARAVESHNMSWWMFNSQQIAHLDELSGSERAEFNNLLRHFHGMNVFSRYFDLNKHLLNPDAVRYVDNLLAQPG